MLGHLSPQDLGIKPNGMYLLYKLTVFMNNSNQKDVFSCFPSLNQLSMVTGWSVSTVSLNLKALVDHGILLKKTQQTEHGNFENNIYVFNLKLFAQLTGLKPSTPEQLVSAPSDDVNAGNVDKILARFIRTGKATSAEAKFLLESKRDLSAIVKHQLTMCYNMGSRMDV